MSGTGVTGGTIPSGHCWQDKDWVPAPLQPSLLLSKVQPLAVSVTLAFTVTLNLRQSGKWTQTRQGEVTITCLLSDFFLQHCTCWKGSCAQCTSEALTNFTILCFTGNNNRRYAPRQKIINFTFEMACVCIYVFTSKATFNHPLPSQPVLKARPHDCFGIISSCSHGNWQKST